MAQFPNMFLTFFNTGTGTGTDTGTGTGTGTGTDTGTGTGTGSGTGTGTGTGSNDAVVCACAECSSTGAEGINDDEAVCSCLLDDAQWYAREESAAVSSATLTVALCRADALALIAITAGQSAAGGAVPAAAQVYRSRNRNATTATAAAAAATATATTRAPNVAILLPPLRSDIESLARSVMSGGLRPKLPPGLLAGSALVTSLVRLSPEKNAAAGFALMQQVPVALASSHLQLLVVGAPGTDTSYAFAAREAAMSIVGALLPNPLDATGLSQVFAATALNIHPCLADAFGMTIVEAAAWGIPSLVHCPLPLPLPLPLSTMEDVVTVARFETLGEDFNGAWRVVILDRSIWEGGEGGGSASAFLAQVAALPPVGACDLLAPSPRDATTDPGVIAWDWTREPSEAAADLAHILYDAAASSSARRKGREGGSDTVATNAVMAAAAAGQRRALAWGERSHGLALTKLIRESIVIG